MTADPGTASAVAAMLGRAGRDLRDQAHALRDSYAALRQSWVGPAATSAQRRADLMTQALEHSAESMTRLAHALQRHSVAWAELDRNERDLHDRAHAAEAVIIGDRVHPKPGIRGLADAQVAVRDQAAIAALEREIAHLQAQRAALQDALTHAMDPAELARLASQLRTS